MSVKFGKKNIAGEAAKKLEGAINNNIEVSPDVLSDVTTSASSVDVNDDTVRFEIPPIILQKTAQKPKKVQLITTVSEETREKLKNIAKKQGVSLNAFLGALYDAIIDKYGE